MREVFKKKPKLQLVIHKDPYKEIANDGLERYIMFLLDSVKELESGKQYDPDYLAHSVMFSIMYITICRKEDKTKSIPRKLEKAIKRCILGRTKTLVDTYKDIVETYYAS